MNTSVQRVQVFALRGAGSKQKPSWPRGLRQTLTHVLNADHYNASVTRGFRILIFLVRIALWRRFGPQRKLLRVRNADVPVLKM